MRDDNGKPFIATLYNMLLAPDMCDKLFSIIKSMNLRQNFLFNKGFCTVFFSDNEHTVVTLPQSTQRKHVFWLKKSKRKNHIRKFLKINFLWNYFIRD